MESKSPWWCVFRYTRPKRPFWSSTSGHFRARSLRDAIFREDATMHNFRGFMTRRRLLASLGVAALVFGVAMLFPYPRQFLFGPRVRGEPWCVWENEVRRKYAEPGDGFFADLQMGLRRWVFPGPE